MNFAVGYTFERQEMNQELEESKMNDIGCYRQRYPDATI